MLSLPNDGRYPVLKLTPQQVRQKTLEALIAQIEAISRQSPALMIFEDAHWADPSSLEVFGRLVDRINGLRVLLFVTSRPEFAAAWIGRPHVTALAISRLAPSEAMALVERVAGNRPLAVNIRQDIVERRRHTAVRGGNDEGGPGGRGRGRSGANGRGGTLARARGPRELARVADGAA